MSSKVGQLTLYSLEILINKGFQGTLVKTNTEKQTRIGKYIDANPDSPLLTVIIITQMNDLE